MDKPLALRIALNNVPPPHHPAMMQAYEAGRNAAAAEQRNQMREALNTILRIADIDWGSDPKEEAQ